MKIRIGFVSNSSTTSFCIFGVLLKEIPLDGEVDPDIEDMGELFDAFEEKVENIGLSSRFLPDDEGVVVGVEAVNLPMDKTLNEMKIIILEKLASLGINKKKIEWHEEAWTDN